MSSTDTGWSCRPRPPNSSAGKLSSSSSGGASEEHAIAFELPGGPQPLAAYARLAHSQAEALRAQQIRLAEAAAQAEDGLRERARRWKVLDLVGSELREREAARAQRAATAAVEEAAQVRAAARLRTRVRA
jgi:hypothetical protein